MLPEVLIGDIGALTLLTCIIFDIRWTETSPKFVATAQTPSNEATIAEAPPSILTSTRTHNTKVSPPRTQRLQEEWGFKNPQTAALMMRRSKKMGGRRRPTKPTPRWSDASSLYGDNSASAAPSMAGGPSPSPAELSRASSRNSDGFRWDHGTN